MTRRRGRTGDEQPRENGAAEAEPPRPPGVPRGTPRIVYRAEPISRGRARGRDEDATELVRRDRIDASGWPRGGPRTRARTSRLAIVVGILVGSSLGVIGARWWSLALEPPGRAPSRAEPASSNAESTSSWAEATEGARAIDLDGMPLSCGSAANGEDGGGHGAR